LTPSDHHLTPTDSLARVFRHFNFVVFVFVVGCAYLFGGENASELEEAFGWIIEMGRRIDARVHQADGLAGVDLRAWNMDS
jgi:hypothetical protein